MVYEYHILTIYAHLANSELYSVLKNTGKTTQTKNPPVTGMCYPATGGSYQQTNICLLENLQLFGFARRGFPGQEMFLGKADH